MQEFKTTDVFHVQTNLYSFYSQRRFNIESLKLKTKFSSTAPVHWTAQSELLQKKHVQAENSNKEYLSRREKPRRQSITN